MKQYAFFILILYVNLNAMEAEENELQIKKIFLKPLKKWEYDGLGGRILNDLDNLRKMCGACGEELEQLYQKSHKGSILNFAFEMDNSSSMMVITNWSLAFWEALFAHNINVNTPLKNGKTLKEMVIKALKILAREDNWYSEMTEKCVKLLTLIMQYEEKIN